MKKILLSLFGISGLTLSTAGTTAMCYTDNYQEVAYKLNETNGLKEETKIYETKTLELNQTGNDLMYRTYVRRYDSKPSDMKNDCGDRECNDGLYSVNKNNRGTWIGQTIAILTVDATHYAKDRKEFLSKYSKV